MPQLSSPASPPNTPHSKPHSPRRASPNRVSSRRSASSRLFSRQDQYHLIIAFVCSLLLVFWLFSLCSSTDDSSPAPNNSSANASDSSNQPTQNLTTPASSAFINLQPTIDTWLAQNHITASSAFTAGILIYDLDHQQIAAQYQPDRIFNVASIYKLFFTYVGYQRLEQGIARADDFFTTTSDYRAGRYTLGECLDLMLRESYNGCADPMRSNPTYAASVDQLITSLNLAHTSDYGLYSSASDLTELLKLYYQHPDFSADTWATITDSLLNQPPTQVDTDTTYDWRQGLPSGFSSHATVYDKVGWAWNTSIWDTFADAAIVEFPELNRHYTVVVLTTGMESASALPLRQLASLLETAISTQES